jgi:DNA-binding response OmpR family regulator
MWTPDRADTSSGFMRRKTILVVDDQAHSRAFIRAVLERQGCRILEAGDQITARRVIEESDQAVALALIDANLPGMLDSEGSPVLETLDDVPVLFLADDSTGIVADDRLPFAPSAQTLARPFTVNRLLAAVEGTLARG